MTFASLINPYVKFKTPEIETRAFYLSGQCIEIMNDMADWAQARGLPFVVTAAVSTEGEDGCLNRISATHRTGRAFDLSIHGWMRPAIEEFMKVFSAKYLHVAAIGGETNQPELIVLHNNGNGEHLHVQISKVFGVETPMMA